MYKEYMCGLDLVVFLGDTYHFSQNYAALAI